MVEEDGVPAEKTTDHVQATGKLYHLRLRVECILFCHLQSRAQTHAVLVIGLYELLSNPTTEKFWVGVKQQSLTHSQCYSLYALFYVNDVIIRLKVTEPRKQIRRCYDIYDYNIISPNVKYYDAIRRNPTNRSYLYKINRLKYISQIIWCNMLILQ